MMMMLNDNSDDDHAFSLSDNDDDQEVPTGPRRGQLTIWFEAAIATLTLRRLQSIHPIPQGHYEDGAEPPLDEEWSRIEAATKKTKQALIDEYLSRDPSDADLQKFDELVKAEVKRNSTFATKIKVIRTIRSLDPQSLALQVVLPCKSLLSLANEDLASVAAAEAEAEAEQKPVEVPADKTLAALIKAKVPADILNGGNHRVDLNAYLIHIAYTTLQGDRDRNVALRQYTKFDDAQIPQEGSLKLFCFDTRYNQTFVSSTSYFTSSTASFNNARSVFPEACIADVENKWNLFKLPANTTAHLGGAPLSTPDLQSLVDCWINCNYIRSAKPNPHSKTNLHFSTGAAVVKPGGISVRRTRAGDVVAAVVQAIDERLNPNCLLSNNTVIKGQVNSLRLQYRNLAEQRVVRDRDTKWKNTQAQKDAEEERIKHETFEMLKKDEFLADLCPKITCGKQQLSSFTSPVQMRKFIAALMCDAALMADGNIFEKDFTESEEDEDEDDQSLVNPQNSANAKKDARRS